jgi:ribosome maturation factor RimP
MDITARIPEMIEPTVADMGFELVRVRLMGGDTPILQIMAERPDGTMTIEGCEELSRALSAFLDVEDPIDGEYNLEVSSPGIDRPLTRLGDFTRFQGLEAKVELNPGHEGQRRFRGRLKGVDGNDILLDAEDGEHRFPWSAVHQAKLVLNDELIKEPPRPVLRDQPPEQSEQEL